MSTMLQMVSIKEIAALKKTPSGITKLNKPGAESYSTYYGATINYFLCGDAYPDGSGDNPLGAALCGIESIAAPALENGAFTLVSPEQVRAIAKALEQVDVMKLRKQVETADAEKLAEEDVDDFELLKETDAPSATLVSDVRMLTTFYKDAASRNAGVVMYTT